MLQSTSMMFIRAMLMAEQFVTLLPRDIVDAEVERGRLTAHSLRRVEEGIIYRTGAVHPPALFALIDAIRAESSGRADATPARPTRRGARRSRAARTPGSASRTR